MFADPYAPLREYIARASTPWVRQFPRRKLHLVNERSDSRVLYLYGIAEHASGVIVDAHPVLGIGRWYTLSRGNLRDILEQRQTAFLQRTL